MINGNPVPSASYNTPELWRNEVFKSFRQDYSAAAKAGATLIITPEFALSSNVWRSACRSPINAATPWCPSLPQNITCGDNTPYSTLACLSKEYQITGAVNLCEGDANGTNWNTQAVFGPDGILITKYRKTHPYLTKSFQAPLQPELIHFNITTLPFPIGIFTCKDILYSTPANNLYKMGIRHFIYSSAIPLVGNVVKELWSDRHKQAYLMASDASRGQSGVFTSGKKIVSSSIRNGSVVLWEVE